MDIWYNHDSCDFGFHDTGRGITDSISSAGSQQVTATISAQFGTLDVVNGTVPHIIQELRGLEKHYIFTWLSDLSGERKQDFHFTESVRDEGKVDKKYLIG